MADELQGKKVAILAADGVEKSELTDPRKAVEEAGAEVHLVSLEEGEIQSMENDMDRSDTFPVDKVVADAAADDYDALILPGGLVNPDNLRADDDAVTFVHAFFEAGKPVGAICHGPWTLIEADVVRGRKLTSYSSIETDLRNAGAEWADEEVVVDQGLVTSRSPDDLPAFCAKLVEEFAEGRHEGQTASAAAGAS